MQCSPPSARTSCSTALRRDGQVVAKDLAAELELSEDTIRRDLRELAADGLLQRVHGGALPASRPSPTSPPAPAIATGGKAAGRPLAAARWCGPGRRSILDGGTTALQLARQPAARPRRHRDHPQPDDRRRAGRPPRGRGGADRRPAVQALGGRRPVPLAREAIGRVSADLFFMGVTGVHPDRRD